MFDIKTLLVPLLKGTFILLLVILYSLYMYNRGYNSAETLYKDKFITAASNLSALSYKLDSDSSSKLNDIYNKVNAIDKSKPTYIIKGTECKPSKDFVSAYNKTVEIVND